MKMRNKFFGLPTEKRPGLETSDFAKQKNYLDSIKNAYERVGFVYEDITRVWCTWFLKEDDKKALPGWKKFMSEKYGVNAEKIEILEFRDEVLPYFLDNIGTSHYTNNNLRLMSLVKQRLEQI